LADSRDVAALGLAMGLVAATPLSATAASLPGIFGGKSYASQVATGAGPLNVVQSYISRILLDCDGTGGKVLKVGQNDVSAGASGKILTADAVTSTTYSTETATTAQATNTSALAGLRALNGLITADNIRAAAVLSVTPSAITLKGGVAFVNLKIAGKTVPDTIPPNTQINLPTLGNVIVKRIIRSGGGGQSVGAVKVEMLHIDVLKANSLGLPVGSVVSIGTAYNRFERGQTDYILGGEAFGSTVTATQTAVARTKAAPTAPVHVACRGTGGKTLSSQVESSGVTGISSTGTIANAAVSRPVPGGASVSLVSKVENVALFGGLIRANSIRAVVNDTLKDRTRVSSSAGTTVTGLQIGGLPVPSQSPNTRIPVAGIGFLVVNEQITPSATSRAATIANGLHLYVTTVNSAGLPVGSQILIGHARSFAYPVQVPAAAPGF